MSTIRVSKGLWFVGSAAAVALALAGCSKKPVESASAPAPTSTSTPSDRTGVGSATGLAGSAAGSAPPSAAMPAAGHGDASIAWRYAASDADVDAAFAQAKVEAKPLFLYWGAAWCPPCNQVKATLFNRQDFIERTRAFVPVYVDGDRPGAQKLGARFHVSGYPTMVLFAPDGAEVTRVPGEVEPQRYTEVVTLGMNARRPVKAVLASAEAGAALRPGDWRLLAFYAWDVDEQQLVPKGRLPALLKRLAAACPAGESEAATRLWLKAIAAGPGDGARDDLARLVALLDDERRAREQFDVLVTSPAEIARAITARGTPGRAQALAAFERTLLRFERDAALSRADRLGALAARVELARVDVPAAANGPASGASAAAPAAPFRADPALLADVRETVARDDREITDGYERQAVVTAGAELLAEVGLDRESDALLQANLAKSHSPYYLMTGLAVNAARRGEAETALRWHREAYERSEGPATRLQWGSRYVSALIELAPADERRIEAAVDQVLDEAARQPDAFYERSAASLRRVSNRLHGWGRAGSRAAVVGRFETRLGAMCDRLDRGDAQRETCRAMVRPIPAKAA